MNRDQIMHEASRFRTAIEAARDAKEFKPVKPYQREPMTNFPDDCCDDVSILLGNYFFEKYGLTSCLITGKHWGEEGPCRGHTWLKVEGFVVDITGDQFEKESEFYNFDIPVYVEPKETNMHKCFSERRIEEHCYPIKYRSNDKDMMQEKYDKVMKYIDLQDIQGA